MYCVDAKPGPLLPLPPPLAVGLAQSTTQCARVVELHETERRRERTRQRLESNLEELASSLRGHRTGHRHSQRCDGAVTRKMWGHARCELMSRPEKSGGCTCACAPVPSALSLQEERRERQRSREGERRGTGKERGSESESGRVRVRARTLRGVSTHCARSAQWTLHYPAFCALRVWIPSHLLSSCPPKQNT